MSKTNQKGFTIVESILVVLVIAVLGLVGWYVWNKQQIKDKPANATTSSSASNASTKSVKAGELSIPAWGVNFRYDNRNVTLQLKMFTYDNKSYAVLTSEQLATAFPGKCDLVDSNLIATSAGYIFRGKPSDTAKNEVSTFAENYKAFPNNYKQVGDYIYGYNSGEINACTGDTSIPVYVHTLDAAKSIFN